MKRSSAALLWAILFALPCQAAPIDPAFNGIIPGGHRGAVKAVIHCGDKILSAGEDGFLEIWDIQSLSAEERFQLGFLPVSSMILRPGKPEVCVIESDGIGQHRISAWNYREKTRLFILEFADSVNYINYSARGNFIIAARSGRTGLVFIHSDTGEILESPADLSGTVGFAATGRSERNMISYLGGGALSYWDLEGGTETGRFTVSANVSSPIIFGNSRFFAGIDGRGLAVFDAASGEELARDTSIPRGSLLCAENDKNEFICITEKGEAQELYRWSMNARGVLSVRDRLSLEKMNGKITAADVNGTIALGTDAGSVRLLKENGEDHEMIVKKQNRFTEAAVSGAAIAFITEENSHGFLPLDYFRIASLDNLYLAGSGGCTRLTAFPAPDAKSDAFLFWQTQNTHSYPFIAFADDDSRNKPLREIPFRFPLRAADAAAGKALFLDSSGNVSVVSADDDSKKTKMDFSFQAVGAIDAAFINSENIIIGRSAISGNTPFLMINIRTGETVPVFWPSSAGTMVYRGKTGTMYGAAIGGEENNLQTSIVALNIANQSLSRSIVEYQGEDTFFQAAEAAGVLASTLGGDGASLYTGAGTANFERTAGLPVRLAGGENYFITVDTEGSLSWHDSVSGKLLALFRLYENEWILQTAEGQTIWGTVTRPSP